MGAVAERTLEHLRPLIGLRLSIARRAADMRTFQFGEIRAVPGGSVGDYALHVQCPWRLEGAGGIVTGRSDLWEPADGSESEGWDYDRGESVQDRRLADLLSGRDADSRTAVNRTDHLAVEAVQTDDCGGVTLMLSGGYRLALFPAGSRGEDWRLFRPGTAGPHFVVCGGRPAPDG
jgi:hypothetical protein